MLNRLRDPDFYRSAGRLFGWAAFLIIALSLLTGYGVEQFRLFDALTAGWWNKASAQWWHEYAGLPLAIVLLLHVSIAVWWRIRSGKRKDE